MKAKWQDRFTLFFSFLFVSLSFSALMAQQPGAVAMVKKDSAQIAGAKKINPTTVEVLLSNGRHLLLDFYSDHIFRFFYDPSGGELRDPVADPAANILVNDPRKPLSKLQVSGDVSTVRISTGTILVELEKSSARMKIRNGQNRVVLETLEAPRSESKGVTLKIKENPQEYFYGGGVQNGRFSHKGKSIAIENQNSWTDGGVASPTPFYWSTGGYGVMWYTFKRGKYDFGAKQKGVVMLSHETNYLDIFFMVNAKPVSLLGDFYQLTGAPVLLPKFGFYEGHLNAYNRDYWKEDSSGIPFEDGRRYRESQKDNGGTKESLNGEKNNYPFSARAVVDRYAAHDLPLGWILPNDGYGAGYGQAGTLDSNILNLQSFGDYAKSKGVQIGLWTQSDLHPKEEISALLQRDIVKEVGVAGVRVLKTDVAWVGRGYSFGLNGVSDAAEIMARNGNGARPFIISLDGWAGTQRYAAVWTGDQTGGVWEYIRFHIPTYIGSGLSGQPNITSDMDGIFGGRNLVINARDFQWKAFTPMQLNMDGWGSNEKYPYALGEPATSINRTYLKLKSTLMPYTYSIAREAAGGLPMIRPVFLEESNAYTLGVSTQYQYLYGPYFLVAPVYKATKGDSIGNDIRDGIYLPKGTWIDYFSGDVYQGGVILNNFEAPLWKLPLFVKKGAILPITRPNNGVSGIDKGTRIYELYPGGKTAFTEYDDDGLTEAYKRGKGVTTLIESLEHKGVVTITVHPAKGDFSGFEKTKTTEFRINLTAPPQGVAARVGTKSIPLMRTTRKEDFESRTNAYFYDTSPQLNRFATAGSEFEKVNISKNPQLLVRLAATDVTLHPVVLTITGFRFTPADPLYNQSGPLNAPERTEVSENNRQAYALKPTWSRVPNADYYQIDFKGQRYTGIRDTGLLFDLLLPDTGYLFKLRAVNKSGTSPWKEFSARTKKNPLDFAIPGIVAESSTPEQEDAELSKLFDFDESSMWHTRWGAKAVPFEIVMDLMSVNSLDKMQYLPRSRGNGILLKGTIWYSMDKKDWKEAGGFEWDRTGDTKEFLFKEHPVARYIKIRVTAGVGDYGSGRELYVFSVPGSRRLIPGDINDDNRVDENDLTSYINYTGLRKGDSDFEGYVDKGDVNKNGWIDAYDISNVATRLEDGVRDAQKDSLGGTLQIEADKTSCNKDEVVSVLVKGTNLRSVNALSFALPYSAQDFELAGVVPLHTAQMENMTNDRLHSDGQKVLYPTFVNIGTKPTLEGSSELFVIKLKAKRKVNVNFKPSGVILVDRHLNQVTF